MRQLFLKLWNDDSGAIISTEWVLIVAIMIFGLIPGLVAVRNALDAAYATIGNSILALPASFSYEGFAIVASPGGTNTIALVNGYSYVTPTQTIFKSNSIAAIAATALYVNPAP